MKRNITFTIVLSLFATSVFAGDTIYKWVENGKVIYSDKLPPSNKSEYSTYSKNSITLKKVVEKELDQDEAKIRKETIKLEEEEKIKEEQLKRKNTALLATYNNVSDIEKRSAAELGQINKIIKDYSEAVTKLKEEQKKAEQIANNKKENNDSEIANLKKIQQDLATAEKELTKNKQLYQDTENKYVEDIKTFKEITKQK